MNTTPVTDEAPNPLTTQGEKVAKMLRTVDRLKGSGLDKACAKFRERMIAKRTQMVKDLPAEIAKLKQLAG